MSRLRVVVILAVLFVGIAPWSAFAAERISEFTASLDVGSDAHVRVVEKIEYDFDTASRHGIFREIPRTFADSNGDTRRIDLSVLSVTDETGVPYIWQEEHTSDVYRIRIGDPDATITGAHVYTITYDVVGAVAMLADRAEIYWNATGNGWDVPINAAHAVVKVPAESTDAREGTSSQTILSVACYEGVVGATDRCPTANQDAVAVFTATRPLAAGEGMTVAVGFAKDRVDASAAMLGVVRSWADRYLDRGLALLVPVLLLAYALAYWYRKGRDPKGTGVVVAEYDAPKELSLLESAFVYRDEIRRQDISAIIVMLAVKGALRIEETDRSILFLHMRSYTLRRTGNEAGLSPDEKAFLDVLFSSSVGASDTTLKLSEIKPQTFQSELTRVEKETGLRLVEKGLFTRNPISWNVPMVVPALVVPVVLVALNVWVTPMRWAWFGFGIGALATLVIMRFMPQRTVAGAVARDHLLGLKRYIEVAETARIEFHNAPEKSPELFEKLLPYAMLFGLTAIWVKEFEDIMQQPPQWYAGNGNAWSAAAFASHMDSFSSSFASSSSPASSGGGSSGGGGGGGGGGSW